LRATIVKVYAVEPDNDTFPLLAGAQFSDAYSVVIGGTELDARRAAKRFFGHRPRWIEVLLALRNRLVKPLGLKTPDLIGTGAADTIGYFRF
jgi:hypothetical protein